MEFDSDAMITRWIDYCKDLSKLLPEQSITTDILSV